jgi:hypothetical protein
MGHERFLFQLADTDKKITQTLSVISRFGFESCHPDDAISCNPVSAPNSLLTGKLTGNFAESGRASRLRRPVTE